MKKSLLAILVLLMVAFSASAQKEGKQTPSKKAVKTTTAKPNKSVSTDASTAKKQLAKSPETRVTAKPRASKPASNSDAKTNEANKTPKEKSPKKPERETEALAPHQSEVEEERATAKQEEHIGEEHPLPLSGQEDEAAERPLTDDEICMHVALNPQLYSYTCWNTCAFCCRSNSLWYYSWYQQRDKNCNWTGDVTLVNTTKDTLELYTERHDAADMPTTEANANSSIANKENFSFLVLIPGDSLTFKMPCGALKYEAIQKRVNNSGYLRRAIGWVRSVSYDVRVEIKEEEMD